MISLLLISLLVSCQDAVRSLIPTPHDTLQMLSTTPYSGETVPEASHAFLGQTHQPPRPGLLSGLVPSEHYHVSPSTKMQLVEPRSQREQAARVPVQMGHSSNRANIEIDHSPPTNSLPSQSLSRSGYIGQRFGPYSQVAKFHDTGASGTNDNEHFSSQNTQRHPATVEVYNSLHHSEQHDRYPTIFWHQAQYKGLHTDLSTNTEKDTFPSSENLAALHATMPDLEEPAHLILDETLEIIEDNQRNREASHAFTPQSQIVPSTFPIESNIIHTGSSSGITDQHASSRSVHETPDSSVHSSERPLNGPHNADRDALLTLVHRKISYPSNMDAASLKELGLHKRRVFSMINFLKNRKTRLNLGPIPPLIKKPTV
ncbi:hypothetical protein CROQUDRAFT_665134 [Cronartium quercuum f. sp. fusiforme G11]|uniref:Uncharacterized protein n=1 Tax=Cronartium quercuum f. sp. fusiforme G11 TaxID=708437 RepID=A0A9P6T6J8_9BASI|nr:hypothetical protein CROQUDRAFT_665134 [Cronartium quercuum f. sp. fusiforme G11]